MELIIFLGCVSAVALLIAVWGRFSYIRWIDRDYCDAKA